MKALVLAMGFDTGGQGGRIEDAFRRLTDWDVTSIHSTNPLGYPELRRIGVRERMSLTKTLYNQADVVHLRDRMDGWKRLDNGQGKPAILHHHGSYFRAGHPGIAHQARAVGAVQVASTLDLTLLEPDIEWLPSPYNLAALAAMREPHDGPLRIAHFPTSAGIKSTLAFLAATDRLRERYPIEILANVRQGRVRHMPWPEVMAQKAAADIYFDQVTLGYGNNAIEAWGMGLPVVAGVRDPNVRALMLERWGHLPFMEATEDTVEHALERLIVSSEARAEYAHRGSEFVQRWHDDAKVVAQLKALYSGAPRTRSVTLPYASPGWLARRQRRMAA